MPDKPKRKKWWQVAREEKRLCRMCREPVNKADWKNKEMQGLCSYCYWREVQISARIGGPLGKT